MKLKVACDLEYEALFPSTLILNVHAQHNAAQVILDERLAIEPRLRTEMLTSAGSENRFLRIETGRSKSLRIRYRATIDCNYDLLSAAKLQSVPITQLEGDTLQRRARVFHRGVTPLFRFGATAGTRPPMKKELTIAAAGLLVLIGLGLGAGMALQPAKVTPSEIASSVVRTPELMERAWALPSAATYARRLDWQTNGSSCGPSSLANVFRSLGEPATNEQAVLKDTGKCLTGMCFMGLTLDELAGVAGKHTQRKVTVLRDLTPEAFREHLLKSNDPARRYVVNFNRKNIFGGGGGHHSPIGGYLEDKDLVFVLDVNGDYGPWLIERPRLFAALDTFDGEKKRGLLAIE